MMNEIVKAALEAAFVAMASTGAGAIVTWLVRLAQKEGLKVSADQQARLIYFTKQAIIKAEEYGAQRLKASLPVSAQAKLQVAVDALTAVGVDSTTAVDTIHAVLPTLGLGATVNPTPPPPQGVQ